MPRRQSFPEDKMTSQTLVEQFRQDITNVSSTVDERQLRQKSHDFHWYSPVLTPQLENCMADVVVQPRSEEEIAAVVTAAVKHRISLTVRGGGTGNYGQSVPLNRGVVVDMTAFNKVIAVESGSIRVQAGAAIGAAVSGSGSDPTVFTEQV
jgi:FAD/FMN-containing dehydrogenase